MSIKPKLFAGRSKALTLPILLVLTGCQTAPERDPMPYSPNYQFVGAPEKGKIRKGYDQQSRLVPDACVTPDVAADPLYLPPGCANNLNLQLMVERQEDLLRGRRTGPAMAAPVVRAARGVIDGTRPTDASQDGDLTTTGVSD